MGDEIVRHGAGEDQHFDRVVGLGLPDKRYEIADQRRRQEIQGGTAICANRTPLSARTSIVSREPVDEAREGVSRTVDIFVSWQ